MGAVAFCMTDVVRMRCLRCMGARVEEICLNFPLLGRDAVIELLDACRRNPEDPAALAQANRVMENKEAGVPMINNRPVTEHAMPSTRGRRLYQQQGGLP